MKNMIKEQAGKISVLTSIACAIHCMALPLLLPLLPVMGLSFLANETVELLMILFAISFAAFSLFTAFFKYHQRLYPLYLLSIAAFLMIFRHSWGEALELYILVAGVIVLSAANYLNHRLCHSCPKHHHDHK